MSTPDAESSTATPAPMVIMVGSSKRVVAPLLAAMTGLTLRAIDGKRAGGYWVEGQEWYRAPDGTIWYDVEAVEKWVAGGRG